MAEKPTYSELEKRILSLENDAAEYGLWIETIRDAEGLLSSILGTSSDHIIILDEALKVQYINRTLPGLTKKKIIGSCFYDLVKEEISLRERLENVLLSGIEARFTCSCLSDAKGESTIFQATASRIPSKSSKPGITIICRDITDHKMAEKALQESEMKYRTLIETTDSGFIILDKNGNVLDANQHYVWLSGHRRLDEIVGRNVTEWTADYDRERNAREVKKCLNKGMAINLEVDYAHKDGSIVSVSINANILKEGRGTVILGILHDITDRKETERKLKQTSDELAKAVAELDAHNYDLEKLVEKRTRELTESREKLAQAQSMANLGSWESDLVNRTERWSDEAYRIFGYRPQEFTPTYDLFLKAIHPDDRIQVRESLKKAINKKKAFSLEFRIVRPDNRIRHIFSNGEIFRDQDGKALRMIGTNLDITDRKETQLSLQESRDRLLAEQKKLLETNTALRVLLKENSASKDELEKNLLTNIRETLLPHITQLEGLVTGKHGIRLLSSIRENMEDLTSSFSRNLSTRMNTLTPREIQVANFIRHGKTNKEISRILNITPDGVDYHRRNLRNKFNIKGKRVNLRSRLLSFVE